MGILETEGATSKVQEIFLPRNGNGAKPKREFPTEPQKITEEPLLDSTENKTSILGEVILLDLPVTIFDRSKEPLQASPIDAIQEKPKRDITKYGKPYASSFLEGEGDLVRRAKIGEDEALSELYQEFSSRIFRYLLARTGNLETAEDLTGDVFERILEALPRYEDRGLPVSAWIFRIASNTVISYRRKNAAEKRPKEVSLSDKIDKEPGYDDVEEEIEKRFELGRVRVAVSGLPDAYKMAIELRFFAGLSVSETARAMGKEKGNVKTIQHKAINRLREILGKPVPKREEIEEREEAVSIKEITSELGISYRTFSNLKLSTGVPAIRVSNKKLFTLENAQLIKGRYNRHLLTRELRRRWSRKKRHQEFGKERKILRNKAENGRETIPEGYIDREGLCRILGISSMIWNNIRNRYDPTTEIGGITGRKLYYSIKDIEEIKLQRDQERTR